jgi:hypothetical protein
VHWHLLSLSLAPGGGDSERDDGRILLSLNSIYGLVVLWVSMERLMGPVSHYLLLRRGRRVVLRMSGTALLRMSGKVPLRVCGKVPLRVCGKVPLRVRGTVLLPIREMRHEIPPPTVEDERRSSLRQELLLSLCLGRGCGLA